MKWKQLFAQEDASSEVIGAVILVGMTVTFAATITPALLGLTQQATSTPVAMFSFQQEQCGATYSLNITHKSGDSIPPSDLYLRSPDLNISGSWANASGYNVTGATDGTIDPGDKAILCSADIENATVLVVWNPEGEDATTLAKWEGPEE